jgi:hypothetical protein
MASHTSDTRRGHFDLRLPPAAPPARLGDKCVDIRAQQQQRPMSPSHSVRGDSPDSDSAPSYIVISGGTGCNAICAAFAHACYVLPVSDDGGSSSEIIRVLGGPSIGM